MSSEGPTRVGAGALRPAVAAAAAVAALAAVDWAAVHTLPGRLVDGRSLRGALLTESPAAALLERVLDLISVGALLVAIAGILAIALARGRWAAGLGALAVLAGANVSTQVLKQTLLVRPDLGLDERTPATLNSLPSGHVTVAFSAVVALVLVLPARLRGPVAVAGVVLTSAVTMAVMSSGWHRASDALAACLVVGAWVALVLVVLALLAGSRWDGGPSGGVPRLLGRAAGVLTGLGALATAALLPVPVPGGAVVLLSAYAAGVALTAGTAAGVLGLVLAELRRSEPAPAPRVDSRLAR